MPHPKVLGATVAALALLTGLSLTGPAAASVPGTGSDDGVPTVQVPTAQTAQTVQLVTGERVLLTGRQVQVVPAPGGSTAFQTLSLGPDVYVVPVAAQPYVGHQLDLGLFDVTRLARLPQAEQLRVRVSAPPGARPVLPGVTLAAGPGGTLTGSLTAGSAPALGRALVAQRASDAAAGRPTGGGLFDGVTRLSAAGAVVAPPVAPHFAQVTLSVHVLDERGLPASFATLALTSTDDSRRYTAFPPVVDGLARVSVPLGHYGGALFLTSLDPTSGAQSLRLVTLPDLSVQHDGQSVVLDARTATARLGVRTPRPSTPTALTLAWDRQDRTGQDVGVTFSVVGDIDVRVAPAPAAAVGQQHVSTTWELAGTAPDGTDAYHLAFSDTRIDAHQVRDVQARQLATVRARYFSDGRRLTSLVGRVAVVPFQQFSSGVLLPLDTPVARTEQFLAPPGARWGALFIDDATTFTGVLADVDRERPAGSTATEEWLRPALLPGVPEPGPGGARAFCLACRAGDLVTLVLAPVTDSTPGHTGFLERVPGRRTASTRLERNGRTLVTRSDTTTLLLPVPAEPATYRLVLDVDRAATGARLGTASHTELTFRSGHGVGAPVPAGWECVRSPGAVCRALPLLQVRAPLPVRLDGSLTPGPDPVDVVVTHAPGAADTPVTDLTAATSTDGTTWRPLRVTRTADGRYTVRLDVGAAEVGHAVDLRLTARDDAGSTISQTSRHAFSVAAR